MSISKRGVLGAATSLVAALWTGTLAKAATGEGKSTKLTKLENDEVIRISPKTGNIHKSNTKLSNEKHMAAMADGGREISKNTVIYSHSGKMYMYDYQDAANTQAAENFQSQFDNDY
jgi:hypothetical protein